MRIHEFVTATTLFWCVAACEKPAATADVTDASAPRAATPAITHSTTPSAVAVARDAQASDGTVTNAYKEGEIIDTSKMSPDNPLKRILERAVDAGPNEKYANLADAPPTPLAGTYNNGQVKFEKVLIECTDTGYEVRLTSAKDGDKHFVSFPLAKEPTAGIALGDPTQVPAASLSVDGVTWHVKHSWVIDFKSYKTTPFKGKQAILGHASGRLIWVPFGHGLKLTPIAGTFTGAPIKARANCKP